MRSAPPSRGGAFCPAPPGAPAGEQRADPHDAHEEHRSQHEHPHAAAPSHAQRSDDDRPHDEQAEKAGDDGADPPLPGGSPALGSRDEERGRPAPQLQDAAAHSQALPGVERPRAAEPAPAAQSASCPCAIGRARVPDHHAVGLAPHPQVLAGDLRITQRPAAPDRSRDREGEDQSRVRARDDRHVPGAAEGLAGRRGGVVEERGRWERGHGTRVRLGGGLALGRCGEASDGAASRPRWFTAPRARPERPGPPRKPR